MSQRAASPTNLRVLMERRSIVARAWPTCGNGTAALVGELDWAATPLGPPEAWPQELRTIVDLVLTASVPMNLLWGPELIQIYNDPYARLMGRKHPSGLGQAASECWPEAWSIAGPLYDRVFAGEAIALRNSRWVPDRHGVPEVAYFDDFLTPVRDQEGAVRGVHLTAFETTDGGSRLLRRGTGHLPGGGVYAAVLRQTPLFVCIADAGLRPVFINDAGRRMVGLAPNADISAITIPDYFHPEDQAIVRDIALPAIVRDGFWEGELRLRHFGGEAGTEVMWRAFACYDHDGALIGVATITAEISERKRTEALLRDSEARLRAAADLVGLSSYSWDPQTGALTWDARLKAMWGLPLDAQVDLDVWMGAIHPEDRQRVQAAVAQCTDPEGDGVYHLEYRVIGIEDQVERWVSTRGQTDFENGRPVWFTGAALEITERKRAEEALGESEARFRKFSENSTHALWIVDAKTRRFDFFSQAFTRIWGGSPDLAGWSLDNWLASVHPEDRELAADAAERVLSGETVVQGYRILRPDKTVRWIRSTAFPIRNDQGRVRRIAGITEDRTRSGGSHVYVVDTDQASRDATFNLMSGAGFQVKAFATPASFLDFAQALMPGVVLLDVRQAGSGALLVPRALVARPQRFPVIVLDGGNVSTAVQAMRAGAVDVLVCPCQPEEILAAVASAQGTIEIESEQRQEAEQARQRVAGLSPRERDVVKGLVAGGTNKSIARDLGISPRTVEIHRAHAMERLGVKTLPEAVLMAARVGI